MATGLHTQLAHSNQLLVMAFQSTDLVIMGLILLVAEFNLINYRFPSSLWLAS